MAANNQSDKQWTELELDNPKVKSPFLSAMSKRSREFCSSTSAHGFSKFFADYKPYRRAMWFLLTMLAIAAMSFQLANLISSFFKYEPKLVQVTSVDPQVIPLITVCRNFPFGPHLLGDLYDDYFAAANNISLRSDGRIDVDEMFAPEFIMVNSFDLLARSRRLFLQLPDFLLSCRYGEDIRCPVVSMKWMYDSMFLQCALVNLTYRTREPSPYGSVSMIFYTGDDVGEVDAQLQSKYNPESSIANNMGVRVAISGPTVAPSIQYNAINLSPGMSTDISLSTTEYARLNFPRSNVRGCDDYKTTLYFAWEASHGGQATMDFGYSVDLCLLLALQEACQKKCNCVMSDLPISTKLKNYATTPFCNALNVNGSSDEQLNEYVRRRDCSLALVSYEYDEPTCRPACNETSYEITANAVRWPHPAVRRDFLKQFVNKSSYGKAEDTLPYKDLQTLMHNGSDDEISRFVENNFVRMNIYFDPVQRTVRRESQAEWFELFSNIGGTMGLWIGASVVTMAEFSEYFVRLLALVFTRRTP